MTAFEPLIAHLRDSDRLAAAARLLQWDQETKMPAGGETARSECLAVIARLLHERSTSSAFGELVGKAREDREATPAQRRLLELVERDRERSHKLPSSLVEALTLATSKGQQIWARARKESDFAAFAPALEEIVRLKREEGACLRPEGGSVYDGLLNDYEWGVGEKQWAELFDGLVPELSQIVRSAVERQARENVPLLEGSFDSRSQMEYCRGLAARIGYDFERGRLDVSAHPFSETIHAGDSRITTRIDEADPTGAVFSTLHEAGHALYEQGLPEAWQGTPLGGYCSMAVHESQSRLWENLVGRSDVFWQAEFPHLAARFPALAPLGPEGWVRLSTRVVPSLIRTEADEATYNLHVAVRFELESALFRGDLQVKDLPGAWNESYRRLLGITPSRDAEGVLQDVHWSAGLFGYFPTYTLGNILASQLLATASRSIETNDPVALLGWLRTRVHARAHHLDTVDLVREICGGTPDPAHLLTHLRRRYLP